MLTLCYAYGVYRWVNLNEPAVNEKFAKLELNAIGDVLAGVFAPLAFLWLFVATMIQGQELALTRQVMTEQSETSKEQAETAEKQAKFLEMQAKAMGLQSELAIDTALFSQRMAMFDKRIEVFNDYLNFARKHERHKRFNDDDYDTLNRLEHKARFIFGADITVWMKEVVENVNNKIVLQLKWDSNHRRIDENKKEIEIFSQQASQGLVDDEMQAALDEVSRLNQNNLDLKKNISTLRKEMSQLDEWFDSHFNQDDIEKMFDTYLNFNNIMPSR